MEIVKKYTPIDVDELSDDTDDDIYFNNIKKLLEQQATTTSSTISNYMLTKQQQSSPAANDTTKLSIYHYQAISYETDDGFYKENNQFETSLRTKKYKLLRNYMNDRYKEQHIYKSKQQARQEEEEEEEEDQLQQQIQAQITRNNQIIYNEFMINIIKLILMMYHIKMKAIDNFTYVIMAQE